MRLTIDLHNPTLLDKFMIDCLLIFEIHNFFAHCLHKPRILPQLPSQLLPLPDTILELTMEVLHLLCHAYRNLLETGLNLPVDQKRILQTFLELRLLLAYLRCELFKLLPILLPQLCQSSLQLSNTCLLLQADRMVSLLQFGQHVCCVSV